MSVNTAHANGGVLIHAGEFIILYNQNVILLFNGHPHKLFNRRKPGYIYLTSHRLIFVSKLQSEPLQSFSSPFIVINELECVQEKADVECVRIITRAQPNGDFRGQVEFKIYFRYDEADDFTKAIAQVGTMALGDPHFTYEMTLHPPPYSPAHAWYDASLAAYTKPPGYYDWLPTSEDFIDPPPNSVFICDCPPPYPGIRRPNIRDIRRLPYETYYSSSEDSMGEEEDDLDSALLTSAAFVCVRNGLYKVKKSAPLFKDDDSWAEYRREEEKLLQKEIPQTPSSEDTAKRMARDNMLTDYDGNIELDQFGLDHDAAAAHAHKHSPVTDKHILGIISSSESQRSIDQHRDSSISDVASSSYWFERDAQRTTSLLNIRKIRRRIMQSSRSEGELLRPTYERSYNELSYEGSSEGMGELTYHNPYDIPSSEHNLFLSLQDELKRWSRLFEIKARSDYLPILDELKVHHSIWHYLQEEKTRGWQSISVMNTQRVNVDNEHAIKEADEPVLDRADKPVDEPDTETAIVKNDEVNKPEAT